MRHAALLVLAVALLAFAAPAGTAVAQSDSNPDAADVVLNAHIQSNGDARWRVSVAYVLNDSAERAGFEQVASEFEAGEIGPSATTFRSAAETASSRTNRSMRIVDVTRQHDITKRDDGTAVGTLTLAFTWTNFANVTEERIVVNDVFTSGWLGSLKAGQSLRIYPPDNYRADSWQPSAQRADGALTWNGPQTFADGGPQMEFVRDAGPPWYLVGGLVVLALAAGVLAAYIWRGFGGRGSLDVRSQDGDGASTAPKQTASTPEDVSGDRDTATGGTERNTAASDAAGDTSAETSDGAATEEPVELLSDEERIERLLRENGGRMKQGDIVDETKWSDAKVSQLLSSMAEEGRVEKLRLGRENLISLPDAEEP